MIFDEIAEVMNKEPARKISLKTGLSKNKIYRLANGLPFTIDYSTILALERLGYQIRLEKKLSHEKDN